MTIRLLGAPARAALVDDVLLDCGSASAAAAAFTGIDLSGVRHVLMTDTGPAAFDPDIAAVLPAGCVVVRPDNLPPGQAVVLTDGTAHLLPRTDGGAAWLVRTRLDGAVLHAPGPAPFSPASLSGLSKAGPVTVTFALAAPVGAQLAAAGVELRGPRIHPRVLVIGGARSGKSAYAESRLQLPGVSAEVTYVATGPVPDGEDPDWFERVRRHRERRPDSWQTRETRDLVPLLRADGAPLLIDGVGTWLAAAMDDAGCWRDADHRGSTGHLDVMTAALVAAWRMSVRPVVAVTDEVGAGVVPATSAGRLFRDELGRLNAQLAGASDEVWFLVAGIPRRIR